MSETEDDVFPRGTVFRSPSPDPSWGDAIDLMVILFSEGRLGLAIVTGYKAGHITVIFPDEALAVGTVMLSGDWLRENWARWVFNDIGPEHVEVIGKYQPPGPPLNA